MYKPLQLATLVAQKPVGRQAFPTSVPQLWNELPFNIRAVSSTESFKAEFKFTYLDGNISAECVSRF